MGKQYYIVRTAPILLSMSLPLLTYAWTQLGQFNQVNIEGWRSLQLRHPCPLSFLYSFTFRLFSCSGDLPTNSSHSLIQYAPFKMLSSSSLSPNLSGLCHWLRKASQQVTVLIEALHLCSSFTSSTSRTSQSRMAQ